MSAGVKSATAMTAPASALRAEEHKVTNISTVTSTLNVDSLSATLSEKTSTPLSTVNNTDILDSSSYRFHSSVDTQRLQQNRNLIDQTLSSSSVPCVVNADKVPSSPSADGHYTADSRQDEQNEDDDDAGSPVELRDTLSSNNVGTQQNSGSDSSSSQEQLSPGLSLLQAAAASSPPPHSYRHSRAYRHFKNPPQPHMCIRTTTETGEELFINVLSWTRIVIPQEPSDPIPLYGGMRVPPGSPRSPPIVFAVMANPEVLKDSGRHSKDPEERRAMVELMCDFVEAMNPGVKLVRNAVILKDRDISGELKDVWNAVQAQRDREREEQMMQQRQQQQHYHNMATNGVGVGVNNAAPTTASGTMPIQQQQMFSKSVLGGLGEVGSPPRSRRNIMQETQTHENGSSNTGRSVSEEEDIAAPETLSVLAEQLDNKLNIKGSGENADEQQQQLHRLGHEIKMQENSMLANDALISNGNDCKDYTDSNNLKNDLNNHLNANNCTSVGDAKALAQTNGTAFLTTNSAPASNLNSGPDAALSSHNNATPQSAKTSVQNNTAKGYPNINNPNTPHANAGCTAATTTTITTPSCPPATQPAVVNPPPTKKEKLGGFLPNGCIFPRFTKNNKHKDKDKEGKTKDKEKNALLSALKKSKDKKIQQQQHAPTVNANQEQQNELNNTNNTSATTNNSTTAKITVQQQQQQQQQQQSLPASSVTKNIHHNIINNSTTAVTTAPTTTTNYMQHLENEVQNLDLNHIDSNKYPSSMLPTNSNLMSSSNSAAIAINKKDSSSTNSVTSASNATSNTGVGVH